MGSPFIAASQPVRRPSTRPVLPRTSSSGSGFFFCGIRLLPVAAVSHKPQNPQSQVVKRIRSSATLLRLTRVNGATVRKQHNKTTSRVAQQTCEEQAEI